MPPIIGKTALATLETLQRLNIPPEKVTIIAHASQLRQCRMGSEVFLCAHHLENPEWNQMAQIIAAKGLKTTAVTAIPVRNLFYGKACK